jgi:hypothetical protein
MGKMDFPKMIRLKQNFEAPTLEDISGEVNTQIKNWGLKEKVKAGKTVAVACSSRGIANYSTIVKSTVHCLKDAGLQPFLFPAMGSHGASTAEGQKKVLENYGITEESMGAPIHSSLEVVQIGETEESIPIYIDEIASMADYILPINRIKSHTEFEYNIESGLMKMIAIGLGKQKGASIYHQAVMTYGYPRVILSVSRQIISTKKILFGVGIVENGYGQTADIVVAGSEELEEKERELLTESKRLAARLPFDQADVLIIDEMGKDISGTGFDTKVVGRILMPLVADEPQSPRIKRIVVCDLTKKTEGNADGVGIADFVTKRLVDKIDMNALRTNAIAGAEPEHARIPLALRNDREAIDAAIQSVGLILRNKLKIIRIKNTMMLMEVDVSAAYKTELTRRDDLEIITGIGSLEFDGEGNLKPFHRFL